MTVAPELLDRCPALRDLPRESKSALAGVAREVHFEAGERLVSLLQPPSRLLILLEGLAKLVGVSESGVERILYVYRPCEIMGSRILLEESAEAPYEVIAMERIHAISIGKLDLMTVARDHPEVLVTIIQDFSLRLNNLTSRMLAAMAAEVPVRLSKLLLDFAETNSDPSNHLVPLSYPLTHESMAQIIGASRPHTSTVLRDLEEMGAVRRKSDRGLLVSPARLMQIVSEGTTHPGRE
ncbi:MAG TPA: Crp/Fnr family transcriptional regulator [Gemmatimonadota bacterium]|nr:Crp/Fnr family transcriptional regulator [Gemmatimonadota bacterium]